METISVNIVAQDEDETLPYTLHCIERVLLPCLKEVVVVDGGSTDNTVGVLEYYLDRLPLIILHHPFDTAGKQKNRGLEKCTGDWVLGIDADNSFSNNLGDVFSRGELSGHQIWRFKHETPIIDEYHRIVYPFGTTIRFWKNRFRYGMDWHEEIVGDTGVYGEVFIFEHCLLQTKKKLRQRGERWQKFKAELTALGLNPNDGVPDRYLLAEENEKIGAVPYPDSIARLIVPRDSSILREIDDRRKKE
jgi:glycosyltransferase involved in cell wall biosynthesis